MRARIPGAGLVFAFLLVVIPLSALDVADGRIRLSLTEGIGRFVLSCQTSGSTGVFVPLLASQDPRTTSLSIVVGNKIYRMGESSEFSEKAEKVTGRCPIRLEIIFSAGDRDIHFHCCPGFQRKYGNAC